ncbi:MAG: hypothetical protein JXB00_13610 [Bacteroidales bacterium]|nr:hypothetical protein [Bacteroidales bacterium]
MPKKLYPLDAVGKQLLEVSWKGNYKNIVLKLNNKTFGSIEDRNELLEGKTFETGHNKFLSVKMVKEMYMFRQLQILFNGRPVEGSMTHPVTRLRGVFWLIIFIASVNLVFGVLGMIIKAEFLTSIGAGFWNLIYAAIFTLLGILVKERKSMAAMIMVIALMVLDILSIIAVSFEYPEVYATGPVTAKLFLTFFLFRGISAIRDVNKLEAEDEALRKAEEEKKKQIPLSEKITEDHNRFMPDDHSGYMPG